MSKEELEEGARLDLQDVAESERRNDTFREDDVG